jgi:hypothetical protein
VAPPDSRPLTPLRLRLCSALAAATALTLALAASASAATVAIPGNPLTVYVGDQGQLQALRSGATARIFFDPGVDAGDAGFFLAFPDANFAPPALDNKVFGFDGSAGPFFPDDQLYTPGAQDPVSGSGTAADPFRQVTRYSAAGVVQVTQTTTYVNGAQEFTVRWDVLNQTGGPLKFRAIAGADFFFEGSDVGTGIFTEGPPRFIGGTNADTGNSGGFVEVLENSPQWSAYQALEFGGGPDQIWGKVQGAGAQATAAGTVFDNSVVGEPVDNAGGVEWVQSMTTPLANNATTSFALLIRNAVPSALQLSPSNAGAPQGVPVTITATATDSTGRPYAGRRLRWNITGANPGSGSTLLAANGTGAIVDPGRNAGADTIVAFVDFNDNGAREAVEPQASALATFIDNVAPDCIVRVRGDRPVGGGPGRPLVITVNCDSQARVTVNTVLTAPAQRRRLSSAAQRRRRRAVRVRLPRVSTTVLPGARTPVRVRIPKRVARKYAGRTLTARVTATVVDTAGNRAVDRTKKRIKLARRKKKRGR